MVTKWSPCDLSASYLISSKHCCAYNIIQRKPGYHDDMCEPNTSMRRRGAFVGASMKPGIHCRSDVEPHWEGFPLAKGTCVSLIPRIPRAQDTCVNIPRISGYSTLAKVTCMSLISRAQDTCMNIPKISGFHDDICLTQD